jgi:hypothetical protein
MDEDKLQLVVPIAFVTAGAHWWPPFSHAWLLGLEHPPAACVRTPHDKGPDPREHLARNDDLIVSRREWLVWRKLWRPIRTCGRVRGISADGSPIAYEAHGFFDELSVVDLWFLKRVIIRVANNLPDDATVVIGLTLPITIEDLPT